MENHYRYKVDMACSGCSGAVERALKRVEGISKVETDLKNQTVEVTGQIGEDLVFETIKKTGKRVERL